MIRLTLLLLFPLGALAGSPFDGTWKTDYKTGHIIKNAEWGIEIARGTYRCSKNCAGRSDEVATDGEPHPIQHHAVSDHLAVRLEGDTKAQLDYTHGTTPVAKCSLSTSADGQRLTQTCTDYTGAKPVEMTVSAARVGKPEPGTHKVSGLWLPEDGTWTGSEQVETFESTPNGIRITQNGMVTDAKFDGHEYPTQNDPGHTLNRLRKLGEREIEWTTRVTGMPWSRDRLVVAADGESILDTSTSLVDGSQSSAVLRRQH